MDDWQSIIRRAVSSTGADRFDVMFLVNIFLYVGVLNPSCFIVKAFDVQRSSRGSSQLCLSVEGWREYHKVLLDLTALTLQT